MTLFAVPYEVWDGNELVRAGVGIVESDTFQSAENRVGCASPRHRVGDAVEIEPSDQPTYVEARA